MDIKALIGSIEDVAAKVLPTIVPGAGPAIAAGHAVVKLIDQARQTFGEHDTAVLQAQRATLMEKVTAHANSTASRLEGG
jgi:hypothetical protein